MDWMGQLDLRDRLVLQVRPEQQVPMVQLEPQEQQVHKDRLVLPEQQVLMEQTEQMDLMAQLEQQVPKG